MCIEGVTGTFRSGVGKGEIICGRSRGVRIIALDRSSVLSPFVLASLSDDVAMPLTVLNVGTDWAELPVPGRRAEKSGPTLLCSRTKPKIVTEENSQSRYNTVRIPET